MCGGKGIQAKTYVHVSKLTSTGREERPVQTRYLIGRVYSSYNDANKLHSLPSLPGREACLVNEVGLLATH